MIIKKVDDNIYDDVMNIFIIAAIATIFYNFIIIW